MTGDSADLPAFSTPLGNTPLAIWPRRGLVYHGLILGYTTRQIADYCGVSETTIRRDMKALGIQPGVFMPDAYRSTPR